MKNKLGGLARYTKEEKKRFEGSKPLLESLPYYPERFHLKYNKFEKPKAIELIDTRRGKQIDLGSKKIVFGIAALPEEFTQYDFLECPDGGALIVHQRVLNIFNQVCTDDFQALPMVIKNLDPEGVKFENKDFWLINILNRFEVVDRNLSTITISPNGVEYVENKVLKDNALGSHLLVIDDITMYTIFHPSLAKYFINSRGVQFLTDEEAPI